MATINIDSTLIKSIIDTYRNAPSDPETSTLISDTIFAKIDSYRIKATAPVDDNITLSSNMSESHCHAFFRMLGLPVISSTQTFYNPGYYGKQMTADKDKIKKISNNQHSNLIGIENLREQIAFANGENFLAKNDNSINYKIDMLQYPRKLNVMKENIGPFALDPQEETITLRTTKNQKISHILRPFKCNPIIASMQNMLIPTKNFSAPFYRTNLSEEISGGKLESTYLETVCKIRFAPQTKAENNTFIDSLKEQLQIVQINGQNLFENVLNNQNVIETYISNIMFGVFVQIILQYSLKINEYKSLATRLSVNTSATTKLSNKINTLKENISYYNATRAFLPTDIFENKGHLVSSGNFDVGVLLSDLMLILDSPTRQLSKELEEATTQQKRHQKEIEEITKDRFYFSGEVLGIGSIDIISMMLAFWIIPQDHLLGMLDDSSFNRLYEGRDYKKLRNDIVESRKNFSSYVGIEEAMGKLDETVYNLLALADSIIEYSNRETSSNGGT